VRLIGRHLKCGGIEFKKIYIAHYSISFYDVISCYDAINCKYDKLKRNSLVFFWFSAVL